MKNQLFHQVCLCISLLTILCLVTDCSAWGRFRRSILKKKIWDKLDTIYSSKTGKDSFNTGENFINNIYKHRWTKNSKQKIDNNIKIQPNDLPDKNVLQCLLASQLWHQSSCSCANRGRGIFQRKTLSCRVQWARFRRYIKSLKLGKHCEIKYCLDAPVLASQKTELVRQLQKLPSNNKEDVGLFGESEANLPPTSTMAPTTSFYLPSNNKEVFSRPLFEESEANLPTTSTITPTTSLQMTSTRSQTTTPKVDTTISETTTTIPTAPNPTPAVSTTTTTPAIPNKNAEAIIAGSTCLTQIRFRNPQCVIASQCSTSLINLSLAFGCPSGSICCADLP